MHHAAMSWRQVPSPNAFLRQTHGFFQREELRAGLVLSFASFAEREGEGSQGSLNLLEREGEVVGAAVRSSRGALALTDLSADDAGALVAFFANSSEPVVEVLGPRETVDRFAHAWSETRGASVTGGMAQRLLSLDVLKIPEGPGQMRNPMATERDELVEWAHGFHRDVGLTLYGSLESIVDRHMRDETLFVWDEDGAMTSMAVATARGIRGSRIGFVYTPESHRRAGRASRLVAHLARHLRDEQGRAFVTLLTQSENPTSNHVYENVGFRFVADFSQVRFSYDD